MFYARRQAVEFLRGKGWITQRVITICTGITGPEMRKCAAAYPQTFLGSQLGYRLVVEASGDEIENNVRQLMSRAEKILHRARSLQRLTFERNKIARRLSRVAGK